MSVKPAERTKNIKYAVRDVVQLAREVEAGGKDMIYLNIGDPNQYGFRTPEHMIEAVHRAMRFNQNGYAPSEGTPDATEAIRAEAARKGIKAEYVCVTTGGSEGIDMALTALVNPGENVLTPSPGYPLYTAVLAKLGAELNPYLLNEDDGWQPDIDDLANRVNDRTRAIILINPNNPTGSVYSRERLLAIVEIARKHRLVIFSDEIYDKLLLDGDEHVSVASIAGDVPVLTFNGISKSYLAPGWRIGWVIMSGPGNVIGDFNAALMKLARARLSSSYPMQCAIKPALEGPQDHLRAVGDELRLRRDITVEMLRAIDGIELVPPRAAFYAFPKIEIERDDHDFVCDLIRATGVVTVHGSGFGQKPGTRHFRVVYLPAPELLRDAYTRIAGFVKDGARA